MPPFPPPSTSSVPYFVATFVFLPHRKLGKPIPFHVLWNVFPFAHFQNLSNNRGQVGVGDSPASPPSKKSDAPFEILASKPPVDEAHIYVLGIQIQIIDRYHEPIVCKSGAQEYCNRTWDGSDSVSPRPGVPVVVWTGAVASSPRTRGTPHNHGPKTRTLEVSRCNTVKSAQDARADQFQEGG